MAGRGYLSQSELPLTFGLGKRTKVDSITVYWPGREAGKEEFAAPAIDKEHLIQQGHGIP
jgi:hypothetical protein